MKVAHKGMWQSQVLPELGGLGFAVAFARIGKRVEVELNVSGE